MEPLRTMLGKLKERWTSQTASTRLLVALVVAVLVAGGTIWAVGAGGADMSLLYANLGADDAGRIVERLRAQHVPYELRAGGGEIWVASAQRDEARLSLASEGLPGGGSVGFELFDEQQFGESEFAEQVKYHRALEGELARTIANIAGVESARVHLVLPQRTLFASNEAPASASVVLALTPGSRLRDEQVRGVVHLVASSVRSLEPEHVTVVDGSGRPLSGGGQDGEESTDALTFRRELERSKETALQELLDRTLGAGTAAVRVAAEVSFSREERTEEQFDSEHPVARSYQLSEERAGGTEMAMPSGIPGAASNLPGGPAAPAGGGAGNTGGLVKRSETRNFEVSKIVRQTVEPVGRLQRLTVAVVVDGNWTGKGAQRRFRPRPADELARIKTIVESAVGAQAARGDVVTVECVPFAVAPARADRPGTTSNGGPDAFQQYGRFLPWAAGAFVALMAFVLVLFSMRRGKGAQGTRALPAGAPGATALGGAGAPAALEGSVRQELLDQARSITGSRTLASDLAAKDPELAARVVRGWLTEPSA